jgi:hypothetical protein
LLFPTEVAGEGDPIVHGLNTIPGMDNLLAPSKKRYKREALKHGAGHFCSNTNGANRNLVLMR